MSSRSHLVTWFGTCAELTLPGDVELAMPTRPGLSAATEGHPDLTYVVVPEGGAWAVVAGDAPVRVRSTAASAVALAWRHLELHVAANSADPVFLHAGAVRIGSTGVILPGVSGAGKTTLVVELARAGATYFSDEYALIDGRGLLHAYPRPAHIRSAGTLGRGRETAPETVASSVGGPPVDVSLVILAHFAEGARWQYRDLNPGEATVALMSHAVAARARTRAVMDVLARLSESARCVRGSRGDTAAVVEWILEVVAQDQSGDWT